VGVAKKEVIPVPLAVFAPALVLTGIAVYFYKKLDWQS
jgi:hypothetical protein